MKKKNYLYNKAIKELKSIFFTIVAALVSVVALHTFVIPGNFAPSGIDGLSIILYELTGINIGWFKLIISVPLLVVALIFLNKKYVLYVILFTTLDSVGVIILEQLSFYTYVPVGVPAAQAIGYRLLCAITSGVLLGICVGIMLRMGYSSGGVDIIACLVHKWKPHYNVERIISIGAYSIVAASFFVYWDLTSILLSVVQIFVSERIIASLLKRKRFAMEVKIVTKDPDRIKKEILYKHLHSATIIKTNGMYTGEENYMVVTVMNNTDIPEFMNTLKKYPDTFAYFSDGIRVQGEFHFDKGELGERIDAFR